MYRGFFENIVFLYVEEITHEDDITQKVPFRRFEPKFFCLFYSLPANCDIRLYATTLSSYIKHFKYVYVHIHMHSVIHIYVRIFQHDTMF